MHIVHVLIHVKPECLEAFQAATIANASASIQEPGILRFDFVQQQDDPTRFMLWEVYKSAADHAAHRETAHYATWVDAVRDMMASPRVGTKLTNVHPADGAWTK